VGVTNAPDMFKSCDASGCTYWVWSSTSANGGKPCGAYWAWNAGNAWETKGINGCEKATVWVNRTVSAADIDQYWLKPA
jgi:hypothetical protein